MYWAPTSFMAEAAWHVTRHTAEQQQTESTIRIPATWPCGDKILAPYLGQTFKFGDFGTYAVTMPATYTNPFDAVTGIMLCLSCHDGNLAKVGMMKGTTVESIPGVGGNFPTLLGNDGSLTAGNYLNDHPVGPVATVGCGGPYDWDCTDNGNGTITLNGPNSSKFLLNYGFTVETFNNGIRQSHGDLHQLP